jgi:hypothetical protein
MVAAEMLDWNGTKTSNTSGGTCDMYKIESYGTILCSAR